MQNTSMASLGALNGLSQDLRYGLRTLAKNRAFAIVAILTLALGIGANTAIFNLLDAALLRTLPVPHPGELTLLTGGEAGGHGYGSAAGERQILAFWEFRYLHDHNNVFSGVFAADNLLAMAQVVIGRSGTERPEPAPEQVKVRLVSGNFFPTLGVTPFAGHFFGPEVDRARAASPVAVISHGFWERRFDRDPAALGTTISIRHTAFEIVAIAPAGFFGATVGEAPDLWLPLVMQDAIYPGEDLLSTAPGVLDQHMWLQVMARRKPGITLGQAQANINVVMRQMTDLALGNANAGIRRQYFNQRLTLRSGAQGASSLRRPFGEPLRALMALAGLVLLIACANVANLLLVRGSSRAKEFALRMAIGAGRARAIRQLLIESLILAVPGTIAGFVVAYWADALLLRMVPGDRGLPGNLHLALPLDARMLIFGAFVAALTTVLFGLAPALRLTRLDLSEALKSTPDAESGSVAAGRIPFAKILVTAQIAASLVMLVATGLFVHSLIELSQVNLGFNRQHLLVFDLDPNNAGTRGAAAAQQFHRQLLDRLSTIPGVRSASLSGNGVFEGNEAGDPIAVEGYAPQPGERMNSRMDMVGPQYFSTLGIPILMGREISTADARGERVAVVNESFARRFFPRSNPLGKHVSDTYYPNPLQMTIVGVAADARADTPREKIVPRLYAPYFRPLWQNDEAHYQVRAFGDPASVIASLRRAIRETSPELPPLEIQPVAELVGNSLATDRVVARLSGAFGALAMLLAAIGLYGVMSWTMARRTREIGIRMAIGARPRSIFQLVLRETLLLAALGIAIGIPLALAAARFLQSLLFGVGLADPLVIVLASMLLAAVALVACVLPARRAAQVDPIGALRHE